MSFETFFLEIEGGRLEACWYGRRDSDRPTLLLLHEGLGSVGMWQDFPARLAEGTGCGVLAYSRMGYGASDPCELPRPLTYMHDEGLTVLPQVLAAANIERVVLVGHSDGGSIALIHAGGGQAAMLRGVVTLAAHVFCETLSVQSIAAAKVAYETTALRERLARYHGDNVDVAFWGWNRAWLDPDFMQWNIEAFLPCIEVPVLAIQGEDDQYGTAAQVTAITTGAPCATSLMLPDCGHSPHRDQPQATLAAIAEFVAQIG